MRKSSSGRLFVLKEVASTVGDVTEFEVCAQGLLNAKVKGQISSIGYLYLQLKVTAQAFPPIKSEVSIPSIHHHTVERGGHKAAEI